MGHPTPAGTRQLWILRHAEADDAPAGGRDRDRPLAVRGRRDATALGDRLAEPGTALGSPRLVRPVLALCSSAVRTAQTADLVLARLSDPVPLSLYRSLYGAGPDAVLTYVREVDEHAGSILVIGHNPTMFELAWDLVAAGSTDRARLESHGFPTCSLAVVDLAVDRWEDVAAGQGTLTGLFAPPY
jgi:phosphohistidine phosphatase